MAKPYKYRFTEFARKYWIETVLVVVVLVCTISIIASFLMDNCQSMFFYLQNGDFKSLIHQIFAGRLDNLNAILAILGFLSTYKSLFNSESKEAMRLVPHISVSVREAHESAPYINVEIHNESDYPLSHILYGENEICQRLPESESTMFLLDVPRAKNDTPPYGQIICTPEEQLIDELYPEKLTFALEDARGKQWTIASTMERMGDIISYPKHNQIVSQSRSKSA